MLDSIHRLFAKEIREIADNLQDSGDSWELGTNINKQKKWISDIGNLIGNPQLPQNDRYLRSIDIVRTLQKEIKALGPLLTDNDLESREGFLHDDYAMSLKAGLFRGFDHTAYMLKLSLDRCFSFGEGIKELNDEQYKDLADYVQLFNEVTIKLDLLSSFANCHPLIVIGSQEGLEILAGIRAEIEENKTTVLKSWNSFCDAPGSEGQPPDILGLRFFTSDFLKLIS